MQIGGDFVVLRMFIGDVAEVHGNALVIREGNFW